MAHKGNDLTAPLSCQWCLTRQHFGLSLSLSENCPRDPRGLPVKLAHYGQITFYGPPSLSPPPPPPTLLLSPPAVKQKQTACVCVCVCVCVCLCSGPPVSLLSGFHVLALEKLRRAHCWSSGKELCWPKCDVGLSGGKSRLFRSLYFNICTGRWYW